jgi:hypothetical protein
MVAVQPLAGTAHVLPAIVPRATLRPVPVGSVAPTGDADGAVDGTAPEEGVAVTAGVKERDVVADAATPPTQAEPTRVYPVMHDVHAPVASMAHVAQRASTPAAQHAYPAQLPLVHMAL